jgi:cytochrome c-type biogenesis protein CcmE
MSRYLLIGLSGGAVLGALLWIAVAPEATIPFLETSDVLRARAQLDPPLEDGRYVRVVGFVLEGSILKDPTAREVRFAIRDGDAATGTLAVVYPTLELPERCGTEGRSWSRAASRGTSWSLDAS